ncbi:uncharacterized protein LOC133902959 [Phragmites australis]|uniref:uncharacterized protein LOC133902959 n=1 Tax=Phragmites australis TaxID=29695 RepID=UPI002D780877|nr:uncharacterized protein LOC133902959 [Phragmites australis]
MGCGGDNDGLTSKVLRHIRGYYREAIEQLPVEEFPSLLTSGACFGLLDPVSNIIVNTTTAGKEESTPWARKNRRKRKRSQKIMEEEMDKEKVLDQLARGMAKLSLDGLLTFLVCHFRYLHTWEALRYLCLAKADLLVAARLIDLDRCVTSSSFSSTDPSSTSFKVALKCAAISAKHPCPATLADIWLSLATSPLPDQQHQLLQLTSHPRLQDLLLTLPLPVGLGHLHKPRQLKALRQYHKKRNRDRAKKEVPPGLTVSLIRQLLDMIHRIYLRAIAGLPRDALRVRHHRGLLKAGHCFGPMDDPVSNILLNTIWYDTAFPPQQEFLVDMLCTRSLARVQARSAAGLISFLGTRFPDLSRHDAIVFLLQADANLDKAISRAQREGHDASGSLEEAYRVAALQAWHPDQEALAEFALSTVPMVPPAVLSHLRTRDRSLSGEDVEAISASLAAALGSPSSCGRRSMPQVPKLSTLAADLVARRQDKFDDDQFFFRGIVEAALQSAGPQYQLHVICGVNAQVAENGKHGYYDIRDGHPYCHINFWARPRGSPSAAGTAPKLFFVECSNDDEDTEVLRCCVVDPSTDAGRCFHCEYKGTKVVHPSFGTYRGCETDFEEMACGEGLTITNRELISCGTSRTELMGWLPEVDLVYFDPRWDFKAAELINKVDEKKDAELIYTACIR